MRRLLRWYWSHVRRFFSFRREKNNWEQLWSYTVLQLSVLVFAVLSVSVTLLVYFVGRFFETVLLK